MSFSGFRPSDFKVFDIDGFEPRMDAIKTQIRPKLEAVGTGAAARRDAHRRRAGLRPRGQARAPHRQPARRHLGGLRARQARLQEALPLQGGRLPRRRCASCSRPAPSTPTRSAGSPHGSATRPSSCPCSAGPRASRWFKNEHDEDARRRAHDAGRRRRRPPRRRAHEEARRPARPRPRRPRRRGGRVEARATTRGSRARPSTCWRRSTRCFNDREGASTAPSEPPPRHIGSRRRSSALECGRRRTWRRTRSCRRTADTRHSDRGGPTERWAMLRRVSCLGYDGDRFCIFDMDGVLIDSGAHHRNAWQALLEELEVDAGRAGVLAAHHRAPRGGGGAALARARRVGRGGATPGAAQARAVHRIRAAGHAHRARGVRLRRDARAPGRAARRGHLGLALGRGLAPQRVSGCAVTSTSSSPPTTCRLGKPDPQVYLEAARRLGAPPAGRASSSRTRSSAS